MSRRFQGWQKDIIWSNDRGRCGICGSKAKRNNWHADHIVPWSEGGETEVWNGQVSHPWCNRQKSNNYAISCSGMNENWRHDYLSYDDTWEY